MNVHDFKRRSWPSQSWSENAAWLVERTVILSPAAGETWADVRAFAGLLVAAALDAFASSVDVEQWITGAGQRLRVTARWSSESERVQRAAHARGGACQRG